MFTQPLMSLLLVTLLSVTTISWAEEPAAPTQPLTAEAFISSLSFKTGNITLPDGIATLNLPTTFRYLDANDAERVLVEAWGNPPGGGTLGMIVPADTSLISQDAWGVNITYVSDGHVNDADADKINYPELLKSMQTEMAEGNAERKNLGYGSMDLAGWAEPPSYDKSSHKLYWALDLITDNAPEHTLNYSIRVLGRKGVLVLNAIASMHQLDTIKAQIPQVLASTDFTQGNTYADFNSSTDNTVEGGLAVLIAGGAAAKLGLFTKLFGALVAFKKLGIALLIGCWMGIKKLFGSKNQA